ncbi:nickel pincer cofactor biosynthesis protein LarB [Rubrobacter indicoceani]|uniref:nickel pincer cofactor biosynthesis protein LarB n=1 Tax=Rubrobacter indicoceani TaxID=2051957 RepID=UPI000E5A823E|nr:nickel pincer cofactor biosynthesis protein LarB [Rubrobacter indicoceani]
MNLPSPDNRASLEGLFLAVESGDLSPAEAALELERTGLRHVGSFAVLDAGRRTRKGVPEVVYAPGKTPKQVAGICAALLEGEARVLVSGASEDTERELRSSLPGVSARRAGGMLVVGAGEPEPSGGRVVALSGGTSDLPVLEEAVAVAREMGVRVEVRADVGVAGLHRLSEPLAMIKDFDPDCVVVAAGMEGALPTVVCSMVSVPVIGLPTSTGYGLGGDGTAAIMGMLQSCSPGLSVVNIDNGVGAGASAAMIANRAARLRGLKPGDR